MKTPREIILERHRAAATKLESLPPEQLATLARPTMPRRQKRSFSPRAWLEGFWREAILPWRRAWAGLAIVWLAILLVNVGGNISSAPARNEMAATENPQVQAELRDQKRLLAQLLDMPLPTDALPSKTSGPRSEQHPESYIV